MATVTAPPQAADTERPPALRRWDRLQARWESAPTWATAGGVLILLMAISAVVRTRELGAGFWMDEALSVGIAAHPLGDIFTVLRHDGSPPLYYLLLHGWMTLFGAGESATHALSLIFSLAAIPIAMWTGWSLLGRRAGYMAAVLFAFSSFLTEYGEETRMYTLMALLGLIATAAFLHAFVRRRRRYLVVFAIAQALMLYTHAWGIFFGIGALLALIPIYVVSDDRRGIVRDAVLAFGAAAILFVPWLPTFFYQSAHTAAPWDSKPRLGAPVQISHDLLGGGRVTIPLLIGAVLGLWQLGRRTNRRSPQALLLWSLIAIALGALLCGWLGSQFTPAWVSRYFAPVLAPMLLIAVYGCARAGAVGVLALLAAVVLLLAGSYAPEYKSDMRDVGGEMSALVHPGDLVIVTQPEQMPLAWYYLPNGLRYANLMGPVADPRYMDWVNVLNRFEHASWPVVERNLLASLKRGQQVLYIRPLTEGETNWKVTYTELIRRRSAQWGAVLQSDPRLKPVAWAPHTYRGACCIADSAVLYRKVS